MKWLFSNLHKTKTLWGVLLLLFIAMGGSLLVRLRMRQQPEMGRSSAATPTDTAARPESLPHPKDPAEEPLHFNNLGTAEMEQFNFAKAAEYFREAQILDHDLLPVAVNLGIALFYDRKNAEAERILREVASKDPRQIEARYVLALIERATGREAAALKDLKIVLDQDPWDAASQYLGGSLEAAQHRWDPAILHFRAALSRDPFSLSTLYALAKALMQKGAAGEAEQVMARYQELKARRNGTSFGNQYLEQGRYAQVIRIPRRGEFPDAGGLSPRPRFVDVASSSGLHFVHAGPQKSPGPAEVRLQAAATDKGQTAVNLATKFDSGAAFLDYDGDGWPDLFLANASVNGPVPSALYRNNHDRSFSMDSSSGLDYLGIAKGVAVGDYDNDGKPDIFIAGLNGSSLYHNEGGGKFREVTSILGSRLQKYSAYSAAFVDLDHDGDLDLFVICVEVPDVNPDSGRKGLRNLLFRNNGNGKFTEIGESSGTATNGFFTSLAILDFDSSRDIDLLLVGSPWKLLSNNRDGSFRDVTAKAQLEAPGGALGLAVGDFDGDGWVDVCDPNANAFTSVRIFWNHGGTFQSQDVPCRSSVRFHSALALDYDNDGDLDILLVGDELHLLENKGQRRFDDVTASTGLDKIPALNARSVAVADYDQDGDLDLLVTRCGYAPLLLHNEGGNRNHVFRLSLKGKVDNRFGIGAKVEWAAGGLWQHREVDGYLGYLSQSSGELQLGLGRHRTPDYVRVLWPSGILQTEIPSKNIDRLRLSELDRKGTSCPILYAWDGEQYSFVTDFLGGSAVGYLEEPGHYAVPDSDEYVKIRGDQLRPKGDRLSIKMVNQLEEVIFFDKARLLAVDHPSSVEIFPNERLLSHPPFPEFQVLTATSPRGLKSAMDNYGRSWINALRSLDRDYVKGFRHLAFRGYAEEHGLTLDLGDLRGASRVLLLLDGWIDYATSSSNFAASQAGLELIPPYLQVWDSGKWLTVLEDMGFPAGLPKTMTVDLSGKIPLSRQSKVRIVTNMRIYWDRIRVETGPEDTRIRISSLKTVEARTSWVGYPKQWSPDGLAPFYYDYAQREASAPWKTHRGNYTPLGNVLDLLEAVDDCYVVLAHGEAITTEFFTGELPRLPDGWARDWLLYVDGFGKDMDLHSANPDSVEPLPEHQPGPKSFPSGRFPNRSRER